MQSLTRKFIKEDDSFIQLSLQTAPALAAPILQNINMQALNSFDGAITVISHPAYWRSTHKKIKEITEQVSASGLSGDEAECAIKKDMLHVCYGKGFLFEAQFEYTLSLARQNRSPVLVTIDFNEYSDGAFLLTEDSQKYLAPYLNWCFSKYSVGNIFIVPTQKSSGSIFAESQRACAQSVCLNRESVKLHGGIIDQCLLETASEMFPDKSFQKKVFLIDNFCYSRADSHIPNSKLEAKQYFKNGVESWGKLGVQPTGTHRCNETIRFHATLPQIKIVF